METDLTPNNANKYMCIKCHFTCRKHSDWLRHTSTRKHNMEKKEENKTLFYAESHQCIICDKIFKSSSGLWKHKKKCNGIEKKKEVNHEPNEKNTT